MQGIIEKANNIIEPILMKINDLLVTAKPLVIAAILVFVGLAFLLGLFRWLIKFRKSLFFVVFILAAVAAMAIFFG